MSDNYEQNSENKNERGDLMGNRICIRVTDGEITSPTFYGHWYGIDAIRIMNKILIKKDREVGIIMCKFIAKIMNEDPQEESIDLWDSDEGDDAANWNWGLWTFDIKKMVWTTTYEKLKEMELTIEDTERLWM